MMTYLAAAAMCWPIITALLYEWGRNQKLLFGGWTDFKLLKVAAGIAVFVAMVWPVGLPLAIANWWFRR